MPKHTHYTLTKIQKVKKHNRTPLKLPQIMFSGHFKSYFDVTKWLYLSVWVVYLLFKIRLPINTIILFIQTDSRTRTGQNLLHEPITAEYNQSYPIISLSHDFHPFILKYPQKLTAHFRGSVKTQWAQGRRKTPAVTLPAGVAVGQCLF